MSKESFEPFIDDLLTVFSRIRNIWTIDAASNGASYILNKDIIGDQPNWLDYPRDLWQAINHFHAQMPPPLVGIGQSLGLFSGIVLCEPALGPSPGAVWPRPTRYYPGVLAAKRKDVWPSREAAAEALAKSMLYRHYDPRVLERVLKYEIREVDSNDGIHASVPPDRVTLTTPKALTVAQWLRPSPPLPGFPTDPEDTVVEDMKTTIPGFSRPEAWWLWRSLPHVSPPVLFVWGSDSELFSGAGLKFRELLYTSVIGTGPGGGGGQATRQVDEAEIAGAHHSVVLEKPKGSAEAVGQWLQKKVLEWDEGRINRKTQPINDPTRIPAALMEKLAKL
ncbi:hypothetical protein LTR86_003510 [Recurvomyces mirabilis]|nr:hypothetical protein LTR86_003510 [Recurvomyces mirabilis]